MAARVCVGAIVGAHGVRGAVRIKSFTEQPADIGRYGVVEDERAARTFAFRVIGQVKGLVIAALDGVEDRDAAEALKGTKLFVARERLPETGAEEFLVADLVGLAAEAPDGTKLGTVKAVFDFGAGDVLEIAGAGGGIMVPFTRAAVPVVDVEGGRVVAVPPVYAPEEEDDEGGRGRED
ncbi:MAG: ribosome maturation factor RimM [Magnetospirillum sp.]|nr:ribosome maturation factor RimM [Magnetospirillum sp.]